MQAIFETLFDIFYLTSVILLGIKMIQNHANQKQYLLFGIMAVVLGCGDAFHLVPRAIALCTTGLASYTVYLGIGKLITSITMTIFYVLLYYVWMERYHKKNRTLTISVWALALIRIVLCLFPQNLWTSSEPSLAWGIYRNIPFALLGLLIIVLFYKEAHACNDKPFKNLWFWIVVSFGCYIPVVLWANTIPLVGMLMIPKTCAYLWMVWLGYQACKGEQTK